MWAFLLHQVYKISNRTTRENKKEHSKNKNKKAVMLQLDNGLKIPAKTTYMENIKYFEIDEINVDKKRVSNKYVYIKEDESY